MRTTLIAFTLIAATLTLAACETTKGLGRDITNASEAVERKL